MSLCLFECQPSLTVSIPSYLIILESLQIKLIYTYLMSSNSVTLDKSNQ